MKKAERLQSQYHLDELRAAVSVAKKSLFRKAYLDARRWYQFHKDSLKEIMPLVTVDCFPRHKVKREIVEAVVDTTAGQEVPMVARKFNVAVQRRRRRGEKAPTIA